VPNELNSKFVKLLKVLLIIEQFIRFFMSSLRYFNFPNEIVISGAVQCLVQLSTLPVAVCYGSGPTSKDAQIAAARNALEYLKIMTKK
jgi:hypothetical protein